MSGSRWACWVALPLALLLWAGIALVVQTPLLPTPAAVLDTFWQALQSGELPEHLLVTLRRVLIAFALAMALGTLLGVWMGRSRLANALLDPLLVLFLNLPALVTIILLYVWFGLVEAAAVLAVVVNKVPNVAVTVREGARSLDPKLEQMARVYGFGRWQRIAHVWLPQLFPYLMAATRGGLALIWKIVLVVELLGRSDGIGFQLHMAFQVFDVASILAYSLAFIAVVQLIELALLQPLERRASAWREAGVRHA
ncbi:MULTISPECIES: ABC transporter permease [Stutzerimonas]|jgi:ABC-type nitrate/sulfonate/bicarbonate transport system permease component|uniref:ABC transporter permease n=1 Tax=Stutzerimonas stutzeri TaxID=316 RepID=A0AA42PAP4_STUST|nr:MULTISPECIES: ABC transporter permease [Stutzerimonas]MBW8337212.1 ABC transporter permease [Pseudomonas sp.]MCJ0878369.1 ABC transporter permease [Pseudomonas sp. JI-2]OHC16882.1 MAG: ABC transporter permease [Pseudomonadales bacterium RIFCSPHIGHO2_01_FULL_64_12]AWK98529.1 ABC transporter permease [Stutzerimonas stutzeri]MBA1225978.1 ABC transporter permease [Stutzerimonas stutzeri]